jgi:hypothetical protein
LNKRRRLVARGNKRKSQQQSQIGVRREHEFPHGMDERQRQKNEGDDRRDVEDRFGFTLQMYGPSSAIKSLTWAGTVTKASTWGMNRRRLRPYKTGGLWPSPRNLGRDRARIRFHRGTHSCCHGATTTKLNIPLPSGYAGRSAASTKRQYDGALPCLNCSNPLLGRHDAPGPGAVLSAALEVSAVHTTRSRA